MSALTVQLPESVMKTIEDLAAKGGYSVSQFLANAEVTRRERFLNALWDQVAEIHDLHFGPPQGTFFTLTRTAVTPRI
jgi:hypothetical protein